MPLSDTSFWHSLAYQNRGMTTLGGGWVHVDVDNSGGSSTKYANFATRPLDFLEEGTTYAILVEFANSSGRAWFRHSTRDKAQTYTYSAVFEATDGAMLRTFDTKTAEQGWGAANIIYGIHPYVQVSAGDSWEGDVRLSVFAQDYQGGWQPYRVTYEDVLAIIAATSS